MMRKDEVVESELRNLHEHILSTRKEGRKGNSKYDKVHFDTKLLRTNRERYKSQWFIFNVDYSYA